MTAPARGTPAIPPEALAAGLKEGRYLLTSDGLEKRCSICTEYWPADREFFWGNRNNQDGLAPQCKACSNEIKARGRNLDARATPLQPTKETA